MARRRILFCTYGGGHLLALLPVIRHYLQDPATEVRILGLTAAGPQLVELGIPHFGFKDLVRPGDEGALARGEMLMRDLPGGRIPAAESIAYLGLSYHDLELRLGMEGARTAYEAHGRAAFLPTTILARALDEVQPDLLIATNSPRAEQAALMAARDRGLPSLCLVDLFGICELPWLAQKGYGSRVCVLNEATAEILVEAGRSPTDLAITGNPAFDSLLNPGLPAAGKALRIRMGWMDKKVILWASGRDAALPSLPTDIEACLCRWVDQHPDWHLVVRPHPNETYTPLVTGHPRISVSHPSDNLHMSLFAVDVVVTTRSTVGIEAWLAGIPLLTCDASPLTYTAPYSKFNLSRGSRDPEGLEALLVETFRNPGPTKPRPHTPATPRVVEVAEELLRGGRR